MQQVQHSVLLPERPLVELEEFVRGEEREALPAVVGPELARDAVVYQGRSERSAQWLTQALEREAEQQDQEPPASQAHELLALLRLCQELEQLGWLAVPEAELS
jgi:hypothetical protein